VGNLPNEVRGLYIPLHSYIIVRVSEAQTSPHGDRTSPDRMLLASNDNE
jgi:hypothetical protein